ncbi:sensor domain-containing diguanylate cyclase [Arcobacter vandammei]|uniref:sensor domain-containing diguanylate cyclase n=1 Tax=Arcobacter vandammei TaxID=2782243 RepID=UPI0018DF7F0D|nr:sensor domain-containing diguanylate cyclase [Arcobacter vandammei]
MTEKQLIKIIKYSPIVVLPLIVLIIFTLEALNFKKSFDENYNTVSSYLIENEKKLLEKNSKIAIEILEYNASKIGNKIDENIIFDLFKNINKKMNDYFFIFDNSGKVILHSFIPELEGRNLLNSENAYYKDATEKIVDKQNSENFITYTWQNPKTTRFDTKISFLKNIPNSDLIIGSGFYPSDLEKVAQNQKSILEKEYKTRLNGSIALASFMIIVSIFLAKNISNRLLFAFENLNKSIDKKDEELENLHKDIENRVLTRTQRIQEDFNKMENIASIDNLTKIYNRFAFFNELEKLKGKKYCIIMFDIDHFKKINDNYGHDVGDYILSELCRVVDNKLRQGDTFARFGGEEFMIIFPNTTIQATISIANRIRRDIETYDFKKVPQVTVSLGVIEVKGDISQEIILKNVDIALYKAKEKGRNTVVVFE